MCACYLIYYYDMEPWDAIRTSAVTIQALTTSCAFAAKNDNCSSNSTQIIEH